MPKSNLIIAFNNNINYNDNANKIINIRPYLHFELRLKICKNHQVVYVYAPIPILFISIKLGNI